MVFWKLRHKQDLSKTIWAIIFTPDGWWEWLVDDLINFWKKILIYFLSYGPLKIQALKPCKQAISKYFRSVVLKLDMLIGDDK